jgi:hypothetical protein
VLSQNCLQKAQEAVSVESKKIKRVSTSLALYIVQVGLSGVHSALLLGLLDLDTLQQIESTAKL